MSIEQSIISLPITRVHCDDCRLNAICLASSLSPEELKLLDKLVVHTRPFKRGEYLFRQGDAMQSLYIITSGSIKNTVSSRDGTEQVVGFYFPGELLGLDAIEGHTHTSSAQALELTGICKLPWENFLKLCDQHPEFHRQCYEVFSRELIHEHELLLILGHKGIEDKLATFLMAISARMKQRGYSATEFNLPMSREDIASFLGVASETVSRVFTLFQQSDMIEVNRRQVHIKSLDKLRAVAT